MRQLLRTTLAGLAMAALSAGSAAAQWTEEFIGAPTEAFAMAGSTIPWMPMPAFSSPLGGSQGFGYYPSTYSPRPGIQYRAYFDGTVSSPFRPGSTSLNYPLFGYFATGEGPYIFPPRPIGRRPH